MTALRARVCEFCGRPRGCFAFVLNDKPGYWHPSCFAKAKAAAAKPASKPTEKQWREFSRRFNKLAGF
jgi:hypothetical protein